MEEGKEALVDNTSDKK
ncbi:unnamed protein product, partial [Adineta steineri]